MGKHLSVDEKLNAKNEYLNNLDIIDDIKMEIKNSKNIEYNQMLKTEIKEIRKRNKKLLNHIYSSRYSKHSGLYGINGICYTMFGKKTCELTKEERTEYNKVMKARQRAKKGTLYDRDYAHKYYATHKEMYREKGKKWRDNNREKIREKGRRRIQRQYEKRGYGAYEGNWTFRTFGKRYVDMTEEEKKVRKQIYHKMRKENKNGSKI